MKLYEIMKVYSKQDIPYQAFIQEVLLMSFLNKN